MIAKLIRTTTLVAVLAVGALIVGCANNAVSTAARSSLTSFVQTLANDAIASVLNP